MSLFLSNESAAMKATEEDGGIVALFEEKFGSGNEIASALKSDEHIYVGNIDKMNGYGQIDSFNNNSVHESKEYPSTPSTYLVEIKHLKRRIKNVQEISIQTSRDAIASDLTKYENNVLNATKNCVNEWRAIARHYSSINITEDNEDNGIALALRTEVGMAVFRLIQLSVQSGPLSGGKPGYFKRCGAEIAKVVLAFLDDVVPQHDALGINCMGFTSKQMDAMKKWKVSAGKAIENGKPPSKAVIKKMLRKKKGKKL